jgi:hypothetical protein
VRFAPQYFDATYRAVAAVLRANPGLRGVVSASWLLDPALAEIAPQYTFARDRHLEGGAILFPVRKDRSGDSGALAASRTRQRLFDEGVYLPEIWAGVWPRAALLRWAARRGSAAEPERETGVPEEDG